MKVKRIIQRRITLTVQYGLRPCAFRVGIFMWRNNILIIGGKSRLFIIDLKIIRALTMGVNKLLQLITCTVSQTSCGPKLINVISLYCVKLFHWLLYVSIKLLRSG